MTSTARGDRRFGPIHKLGVLQREQIVDPWIAPVFMKRPMDQPFVQRAVEKRDGVL